MNKVLITHSLDNITVQKESDTDKFMLTNNGGYFYFNPDTKYRGLYFPVKKTKDVWTLFKTIDEIKFNIECEEIINNFSSIERTDKNNKIKYSFSKDALFIEADYKGEIIFTLDMRETYDFDDKGRIYKIAEENGCILVEYKKFFDNLLEHINYTSYIAIKTDISHYEKIMQWKNQHFSEDEERKSNPYELYVFDAFKLKCNRKSKIAIAYSENKDEAVVKARTAFRDSETDKPSLKLDLIGKSMI